MLIFYKVVLIHPRSLKGLFNNGVDSSMMVDKNRLRRSCDLHSFLLATPALSQAHVVPLKSCLEVKRAKIQAITAIPPTQTHKNTKSPYIGQSWTNLYLGVCSD